MKKIIISFILTVFVLVGAASFVVAQTVIKHPDPVKSLQQKWQWAVQLENSSFKNGFWIGYKIKRLMGENSFTGSFHYPPYREESLAKLLGEETEPASDRYETDVEAIRSEAKKALEQLNLTDKELPERKVWKDLAFLYHFRSDEVEADNLDKIRMSNLSLHVDLENDPLVWLGQTTDRESIEKLRQFYKESDRDKVKEKIVTAVALHEQSALVTPFLQDMLMSDAANDIREKAAFWLGQRDDEKSLQILEKTVALDRSQGVREQAVFAISQMDIPAATDELIKLAKNNSNRKVRKKAIFWLGQKASKKAAEAIEDMVYNEKDTEIQERAVFAISQLPDDQGVPKLIQIAKEHPNVKVRKKAIFWLGQSDDERAIDAIVQIVQGK